MVAVILLLLRQQGVTTFFGNPRASASSSQPSPAVTPQLGPRHKLNYQQWLNILSSEAKVAASKQPQHLTVLLGDSLSIWFPQELLPTDRNWLNQGISGETSAGVLERVGLLDQVQPQTILLMIGINDLIKGVSDETILNNQRQILRYLRRIHPQTQIVAQSILPHAGAETTWEGREKLLAISNQRISQLNQKLQALATEEGVNYLHLYPLFTDERGNLRPDFTTDGLHLNDRGYLIWRSALLMEGERGRVGEGKSRGKGLN